MSIDSVFNMALEAFNKGDYDLLIKVLFGFSFLWLYNELRKDYNTTKSQNRIDLADGLESYSNLHHSIIAFQNDAIDLKQLFNNINKAIIFLPKNFTKTLLELDASNLNKDCPKLQEIKDKIKHEIVFLKSKQHSISTYDPNEDIFNQGSWFLSINNFDSFGLPFIYTTFISIIFIYFFLFGKIAIGITGFAQINLFIILLNFIVFLILLIFIFDLTFKRSLRKEASFYFLILVLFPWILCTFIINLDYSLINTATIILFIYLANKKGFMKLNTI